MKMLKVSATIFLIIMSLIACELVQNMTDTTRKTVKQVREKTSEVVEGVQDSVVQQIDKTRQELTLTVKHTVDQILRQIKEWIFEVLKPFFPWIFIVFFLLLHNSLRSVIPFGSLTVIEVPVGIVSYTVAFYIFSSIGLWLFALQGSAYLIVPILVICLILYLC